ncbi:hypothetical protein HID58_087108, partial [Brassica napus]
HDLEERERQFLRQSSAKITDNAACSYSGISVPKTFATRYESVGQRTNVGLIDLVARKTQQLSDLNYESHIEKRFLRADVTSFLYPLRTLHYEVRTNTYSRCFLDKNHLVLSKPETLIRFERKCSFRSLEQSINPLVSEPTFNLKAKLINVKVISDEVVSRTEEEDMAIPSKPINRLTSPRWHTTFRGQDLEERERQFLRRSSAKITDNAACSYSEISVPNWDFGETFATRYEISYSIYKLRENHYISEIGSDLVFLFCRATLGRDF